MACEKCNDSKMEKDGKACRVCCLYARLDLIPYCIDCGSPTIVQFWGGGPRCMPCDHKQREYVFLRNKQDEQRKWDATNAHIARSKADGVCPDDGYACDSCCEHDHVRSGICSDCQTDVGEYAYEDNYWEER